MSSPQPFQAIQPRIPHFVIPERDTLVLAEYIQDQHTEDELHAQVTFQGEPIEHAGEALLVGMVPPERRYAIAHAGEDGHCECLPQEDFQKVHEKQYRAIFAVAGERCDDVHLRHIPKVQEYVACKLDPNEPSQVLPVGMGMAEAGEIQAYWDDKNQEIVTPEERGLLADKEAEIAELQAKLDDVNASRGRETPAETSTAPCGHKVKNPKYLSRHVKQCQQPECIAATEASAA